ncbi:hypothetical protein BLNAU_2694 [Blattamonas nauphoetae]|uniref:Uncharacterized protein n=1 Tax=Blattamonas nauphoetae TaxID=2049346 RepID=A0ABQ9YFP1_9EUKA|nr:hypothetical protein BLNAU_2694 [Blattamonas nauphoetae]
MNSTTKSATGRTSGSSKTQPGMTSAKQIDSHLTPGLTMTRGRGKCVMQTKRSMPVWKQKSEFPTSEYRSQFVDTRPFMQAQAREARLRGETTSAGKKKTARSMYNAKYHESKLFEVNPIFLNEKTRLTTTSRCAYQKLDPSPVGMENPAILKQTISWRHHQANK